MNRIQWALIAGATALIAVLFLLPRGVVQQERTLSDREGDAPAVAEAPHDEPASPQVVQRLRVLRINYERVSDTEKKVTFADSLTSLYQEVNKFDSAAYFMAEKAKLQPSLANQLRAGDGYYEAFSYAVDPERARRFGEAARTHYQQVLDEQPGNLDVKARLAMTYVAGENPMQGISLLRDILAENPAHEQTLFNLGMLAVQSGQYDRAVERFRQLIAINDAHVQGRFFLGVSYKELGQKPEALAEFRHLQTHQDDPEMLAAVESYLKELE